MEYEPIRKRGLSIPWGYEQHPDDRSLLLPIPEQLEVYARAKELLKRGCSYRDVANWMTAKTGRRLTHAGLRSKVKADIRRRQSEGGKVSWERNKHKLFPDKYAPPSDGEE